MTIERYSQQLTKPAVDQLIQACPEKTIHSRFCWFWKMQDPYFLRPLSESESRMSKAMLEIATEALQGPWYHGGAPNIKPGTLLKPGNQIKSYPRRAGPPSLHAHIFFTKYYSLAKRHADRYLGGGGIFEVEPTGKIEADPSSLRAAMVLSFDPVLPDDFDLTAFIYTYCVGFRSPRARVLRQA